MLLAALGALALARSPAELIDGTPEFQGCLDNPGCYEPFTRFLSESMGEQGFAFQPESGLVAPTVHRAEGGVVGLRLTTFPLGPPPENLSGKEENTSPLPVLPRLVGGWSGPVADDVHIGVGGSFLPPVPVAGASALVASLEGALAVDVSDRVRVGAEVDLGYSRARAAVVASEEQYEARETFDNPSNLRPETYEAVCEPAPDGCIDTFTVASATLRLAASIDAGAGFVPYARLGLGQVDQRLWVMYDDTTWRVRGLQPTLGLGSTWTHEAGPTAHLGATVAPRTAALSESGDPGVFFRAQGAFGWRF